MSIGTAFQRLFAAKQGRPLGPPGQQQAPQPQPQPVNQLAQFGFRQGPPTGGSFQGQAVPQGYPTGGPFQPVQQGWRSGGALPRQNRLAAFFDFRPRTRGEFAP